MRRQRLLAALAAAAMVVAIVAAPAPAAAAPKKYKATRAFVVDKVTGAVRMPTQTEVDALVATLETLGQKSDAALPTTTAVDGTVSVDLTGGFGGVLLARPAEGGVWETLCVFTVEDGANFLGLVEDVQ
jgi:hypothetical protein